MQTSVYARIYPTEDRHLKDEKKEWIRHARWFDHVLLWFLS